LMKVTLATLTPRNIKYNFETLFNSLISFFHEYSLLIVRIQFIFITVYHVNILNNRVWFRANKWSEFDNTNSEFPGLLILSSNLVLFELSFGLIQAQELSNKKVTRFN
jgi:hypothetical protein